jgi:ribonuclease HI
VNEQLFYVDFSFLHDHGAGYLLVMLREQEHVIAAYAERVNVAEGINAERTEYRAVLCALTLAAQHGIQDVVIYCDNQTVVTACARDSLRQGHSCHREHKEFLERKSSFTSVTVEHISRKSNRAHKRAQNVVTALLF